MSFDSEIQDFQNRMVTPEGQIDFSGIRELCGQLEDYGNYLQELADNRNILNVS